jgi:prepilin-type N-terminal cleavage/methylation domain-containing protein
VKTCKPSSGLSLTEVLVSLFILGVLSIGIYFIISHGRFTAATTQARGQAKQEAQLAMRYLTREISNSRATIDYSESDEFSKIAKKLTFAGGVLDLEVPRTYDEEEKITYFDSDKDDPDKDMEEEIYMEVKYEWNEPEKTLTREDEDLTKTLSNGVTHFDVNLNYDGKVQVEITVEKPVKGFFGKTVEYSESAIITIKAAEKIEARRGWRQRIKSGEY